MVDFIKRIITEKDELGFKISKLRGFMEGDAAAFKALPKRGQCLLEHQLNHMQEYYDILTLRLDMLN